MIDERITPMTDLAEFLLARIAEDEAQARAATQGNWVPWPQGWEVEGGAAFITAPYHELDIWPDDVQHITRWQPARVLAECEAKRAIVTEWGGWTTGDWYDRPLRWLATAYADHPDYRQAWAL